MKMTQINFGLNICTNNMSESLSIDIYNILNNYIPCKGLTYDKNQKFCYIELNSYNNELKANDCIILDFENNQKFSLSYNEKIINTFDYSKMNIFDVITILSNELKFEIDSNKLNIEIENYLNMMAW